MRKAFEQSRNAVVVELTAEDCRYLADKLRRDDIREIWAASRREPLEALMQSFKWSTHRYAVLLHGLPVAAFGAAPRSLLSKTAMVWLVGTPDIEKMKITFVRHTRSCIARMLQDYEELENYVDARNIVSLEWLKYAGAVVDDAAPYGPDGLPFHHFTIRRGAHV